MLIITTKHIMLLLGYSERVAQKHLAEIRESLEKPPRSPVTVGEFCKYHLMNPDEVREAINQPLRRAS